MKSVYVCILLTVATVFCLATNAFAVFKVYITSASAGKTECYNSAGTRLNTAISSGTYGAIASAPDGGLWAALYSANAIERFDTLTSIIDASMTATISKPGAVGIDLYGVPYVADNNSTIYRYDGYSFVPFVSPFPALHYPASDNVSLVNIGALAFGPDGNLYVAAMSRQADNTSMYFNTVERFNGATGAYMGTFATIDNNTAIYPSGLAFYNGKMYVAAIYTSSVFYFDAATGGAALGYVDCGIAAGVQVQCIAFDPDGNLYVPDYMNKRVMKFLGPDFGTSVVFATLPTGELYPKGVAIVNFATVSSLSGTVVPDNYTGDIQSVGAWVELRKSGGVVRDACVPLDATGTFKVNNLDNGTYDVAIKTYAHLQKVLPGVVVSGATTIGTAIHLDNGDCDRDNEVTSADLAILLANMD